MRIANVNERAGGLARASFIALGFSIPISAAVDGILTAVIVLAWLAALRFRETACAVRDNPAAAVACIWFLVHALGALWSIGEPKDVMRVVSKSATFLLVPIAAVTILGARDRRWALDALMWAIGLTAVLSTLRWLGAIPDDVPFLKSTSYSASVVFKYHLTQNLLVAFGAFLFAVHAREASIARERYAWAAASVFAAVNVLVMGDGRIGQVVLVLLLVYFAAGFGSARVVIASGTVLAITAAAIYVTPESALHRRSTEAVAQAFAWSAGERPEDPSSIGDRLDFYQTSAGIVAKHPLLGVGTGGFPAAYELEVAGTELQPTRNPHNEYLLQAVELGMAGVLLLGALFLVVWQQASRLATRRDTIVARGLVITFAATSLASSPLADHTELTLFVWLVGVLFAGHRSGRARPGESRAPATAHA